MENVLQLRRNNHNYVHPSCRRSAHNLSITCKVQSGRWLWPIWKLGEMEFCDFCGILWGDWIEYLVLPERLLLPVYVHIYWWLDIGRIGGYYFKLSMFSFCNFFHYYCNSISNQFWVCNLGSCCSKGNRLRVFRSLVGLGVGDYSVSCCFCGNECLFNMDMLFGA